MTFTPSGEEVLFTLESVAGLRAGGLFGQADTDTLRDVLTGAARFASEVVAPLDKVGDVHGARLEPDGVRVAPGFADAYGRYVADGWGALAAPEAMGGAGLPRSVGLAVQDMINGASLAFGLAPLLTQSAVEALASSGDEAAARRWVPRLATGEWTGAMALTESAAGSDVGAIRARAVLGADGAWRLSGDKIFITWGEHDMAANIVHLVLARAEGAPDGVRGLSLFAAPRRMDDAAATPNAIRCVGLERKLGIHGSPTCAMRYEQAKAWLVGGEGQGMAAMFGMMNPARLHVGMQGASMAERAFQHAQVWARGRVQGRCPQTGAPGAAIIRHADVRRMLMTMKAHALAARALCLTASVLGESADLLDGEAAKEAQALGDLLTPIAKGWSSEVGVMAASLGIQVHGGAGYVEETGAAQLWRDARIAPIYEGTNGIQANDLVGRKIARAPESLDYLWARIGRDIALGLEAADEATRTAARALAEALPYAQGAGSWMVARARANATEDALAGAWHMLEMMGVLLGGWMLTRGALASGGAGIWPGLARFYAAGLPLRVAALAQEATAGAERLDAAQAAISA